MRAAVQRCWVNLPVQEQGQGRWRQVQAVEREGYQVLEAQQERPLALEVEPGLALELALGQREVLEAPMGKPLERPGQQQR